MNLSKQTGLETTRGASLLHLKKNNPLQKLTILGIGFNIRLNKKEIDRPPWDSNPEPRDCLIGVSRATIAPDSQFCLILAI